MDFDIDVIIVNYNGRSLLADCLDSIITRPKDGLAVRIIVVDNDSTDDSVEFMRRAYPSVDVIESRKNLGFAAGNNLGIARSSSPLVLLLNSDARLTGNALAQMAAAINADPAIGQLGPRLRNPDGSLQKSVRGFPTPWRLATEYLYLRKLAPNSRLFNAFYAGGFDFDSAADADFLMGACLLVRRAAIDEVGLMNETYFMFSEETDWAYRFWQSGWRVQYAPVADVIHLGGQSTKHDWDRMYRSQVAGHLRFLVLHHGIRTARRAQHVLLWSLRLRTAAYRLFGVLPVPGARSRRQRAKYFASAAQHIRQIDVHEFTAMQQGV